MARNSFLASENLMDFHLFLFIIIIFFRLWNKNSKLALLDECYGFDHRARRLTYVREQTVQPGEDDLKSWYYKILSLPTGIRRRRRESVLVIKEFPYISLLIYLMDDKQLGFTIHKLNLKILCNIWKQILDIWIHIPQISISNLVVSISNFDKNLQNHWSNLWVPISMAELSWIRPQNP